MDKFSIRKANKKKQWIADNGENFEILYQPAYCPDVNPVELTRARVKRQVRQQVSKTKAQIRASLKTALDALKRLPEKVQAFFREADCQYILA